MKNFFKEYSKVITFVFMLILLILIFVSIFVEKNNKQEKSADLNKEQIHVNISEDEIKKAIAKFKNFGDINISNSQIDGLMEITVINTGEVFYSSKDGSILLVGAMIDSNGHNYTKDAMDKASAKRFQEISKTIDKDLAIKVGNGKHEILAFTDPDCSYCRAAEKLFKESEDKIDVTKYIYFTPLDSIHPEAAKKAIHILCSNNPEKELFDVMQNKVTSFNNQCEKGINLLEKHRELGKTLGVTGTPTFYVDGVRYVGVSQELINKISK